MKQSPKPETKDQQKYDYNRNTTYFHNDFLAAEFKPAIQIQNTEKFTVYPFKNNI